MQNLITPRSSSYKQNIETVSQEGNMRQTVVLKEIGRGTPRSRIVLN